MLYYLHHIYNIHMQYVITRFDLYYNGKILKLWVTGVPIVPHSWYHQCSQLNTVTGLYLDFTLIFH